MPDQEVQQKAEGKLKKLIDDITSLEVVTLSGDVTFADLKVDTSKPLNFDKVMEELYGNADMASRVKVVAATKYELDKDVLQFVKENMTREEKELFMIHIEATQSAQQARRAIMEILLNVIKDIGL